MKLYSDTETSQPHLECEIAKCNAHGHRVWNSSAHATDLPRWAAGDILRLDGRHYPCPEEKGSGHLVSQAHHITSSKGAQGVAPGKNVADSQRSNHGSCFDDPHWSDAEGHSCSLYEELIESEEVTQESACESDGGLPKMYCRRTCGACTPNTCEDSLKWTDADGHDCALYARHIESGEMDQQAICDYDNGNAKKHCPVTCGVCVPQGKAAAIVPTTQAIVSESLSQTAPRARTDNIACLDSDVWRDKDNHTCARYKTWIQSKRVSQSKACSYGDGEAKAHCRQTCGQCSHLTNSQTIVEMHINAVAKENVLASLFEDSTGRCKDQPDMNW